MTAEPERAGAIAEFRRDFAALAANIQRIIRGKDDAVESALCCLFAGGHLLIEDVPGVAKTSLALALARSVSGQVRRIQFTPDLLPSDVIGGEVYRQSSEDFVFRRGPVFTNILVADEINRGSPKTQSALLEAMAENAVTVAGTTHRLTSPFFCVATQNPDDHRGTYALPEAQLDRFTMRIGIGYPEPADEVEIVEGGLEGRRPDQLSPVIEAERVVHLAQVAEGVHVATRLRGYIVALVAATRTQPEVQRGASPRGSIALARCARVWAASQGDLFTTPDHVQRAAPAVLGHRLVLTAEAMAQQVDPGAIVQRVLDTLPVPQVPVR
jgi:MoxR-like ATPase